MGVIFRIALRNLVEHRTKTLIIGSIIAVCIMALMIGNAMIDTATAGIRRTYIDNFTGHLLISGESDGSLSLFGSQDMTNFEQATPLIPDYPRILEFLENRPGITGLSPQVTGMATARFGDEGMGFMQLFGVDIERYRQIFPDNIEITAGRWLAPGEEGLMLSGMGAAMIERTGSRAVVPGDKLLLTGLRGTSGTNIRELEVKGIFRFINSNLQLNMVSLIDVDNLRSLMGMTVGANLVAELTASQQNLLTALDDDALFGAESAGGIVETVVVSGEAKSEASLLGILGDTSERDRLAATDSGAWHFLIVKLSGEARLAAVQRDIRRFLAEQDIPAEAGDWRKGAGALAQITYTAKLVFNIIILIIAVVAILIIMNTIVISVLERIPEIGTMRAIGAQRGFVRQLIIVETLSIAGIFGALGLLLGSGVVLAFNLAGIAAPNMFFEILFGGSILRPELSAGSAGLTMLISLAAGLSAALYPVSLALKIKPVTAIQAE